MSTTFEELTSMREGQMVSVAGVGRGTGDWRRVANGLQQGDAVLPLLAFEGLARQGHVTLRQAIDAVEIGSTFSDGRWSYVLVDRVQGENLMLAVWRRETWQGLVTYNQGQISNFVWQPPTPESRRALAVAVRVKTLETQITDTNQNHQARIEEWRQAVAEANGRALAQVEANERQAREAGEKGPEIPGSARSLLHEYAASIEDEDFDAVLANIGIGRELTHVVSVKIEGRIRVEPTYDFGSYEFDVDDTECGTLYWSRTVTLEKTGVGCRCEDVTRADLGEFLPNDAESWDFTTECDS